MTRAILTTLALLAATYAIAVTWRENRRAAGLDFYICFVNGQLAARTDVVNIYASEVQARIGEEYFGIAQQTESELRKFDAGRRRYLDTTASPFLYTTLRWVSRDYERALTQYHALVLAAFVGGFLLIAWRVRMSWASALFLLSALLLWYRGFEADLRVGNVNSLQLAGLAAALVSPPAIAGAICGMLVAFKPNLLLVPLLLAVSRAAEGDWLRLKKEVLGGTIGGLAAFTAGAISYGTPLIWLQWVGRAREFYYRIPGRNDRNVTPALALFHEHGAWLSHALAALLTVIAIVVIWRAKRRDDVLVASIGTMIYLLSATVVWLHYTVLVVPVALALMRRRVTAVITLLALLAIAEEPFERITKIVVYPNDAKYIAPAMVVLFACALWSLLRSDPDPAAA